MYYPYFRGKQYELITVRENARLIAGSNFVPIVEPVKESFSGLKRAIDAVVDENGSIILIINPFHGDHAKDNQKIIQFIKEEYRDQRAVIAGILLTEESTAAMVSELTAQAVPCDVVFIHAGFSQEKQLAEQLGGALKDTTHIFLEENCGKLYQSNFRDSSKVLVRDGFHKRANREYPDAEFFSELHITYEAEGMSGFSDFLMVGNDYTESGGPAYAVAIHLTFINPDKDNVMFIHHFKSDRQDSPTDPGGKFLEALRKLVDTVQEEGSHIYQTDAVKEFVDLYNRKHFPGLGYVKKLSMQHHIETLAQFLEQ